MATPVLRVDGWRITLQQRTSVAAALLALWAAGIEARLVHLQVFRHADLMARAERQQLGTSEAPAKRGDIVDRTGHVLATSVDADTIYAVPSEIRDPDGTVARLCAAIGDCTARERPALAERLRERLRGRGSIRFGAVVRQEKLPDCLSHGEGVCEFSLCRLHEIVDETLLGEPHGQLVRGRDPVDAGLEVHRVDVVADEVQLRV